MTLTVQITTFADEIVHEVRNGVESFFVPDTLGSTAMLFAADGTVTDEYTYWSLQTNRVSRG